MELRKVGAIGDKGLRMSDGPAASPYAKTIGDRYYGCGLLASGDERGVVSTKSPHESTGLEVTITNACGQVRMSVDS